MQKLISPLFKIVDHTLDIIFYSFQRILSAFFLIFFFLFFNKSLFGQLEKGLAEYQIDNIEVRGLINARGTLFDGFYNKMSLAYPANQLNVIRPTQTISFQETYCGALLENGQAMIYNSPFEKKYPGYGENQSPWNNVWVVYRYEIEELIYDFQDNGIIDKTPSENLLFWPGKGNPYLTFTIGTDSPDDKTAPFFDRNLDGIYNPLDGDYPIVDETLSNVIPDVHAWVYYPALNNFQNDSINVRLQIFAFHQQGLLERTFFVKQTYTNRTKKDLYDFRIGHMVEFKIGCHLDNAFGCSPIQSTFYGYNATLHDMQNCAGLEPSYQDTPPIQTVTFLNHNMSAFIGMKMGEIKESPNTYLEAYRILNGIWYDGSPLTIGGNGHKSGGMSTKYMFPDSPSNSNGWNYLNSNLPPWFTRCMGSTGTDFLAMDSSFVLFTAYTTHPGIGETQGEWIDNVIENISELHSIFNSGFELTTELFPACQTSCVWPGDLDANGEVNNLDLLHYAHRIDQIGSKRLYPFIGWYPQHAVDWIKEDQLIGNPKHTDGNGDGIIDSRDADLVILHEGRRNQKFQYRGGSNDQGDELYFHRVFNPSVSKDTILSAGKKFQLNLYLSLPTTKEIKGLAFSIRYEKSVIEPSPSSLPFYLNNNHPWLKQSQFYIFEKEDGFDIVLFAKDGTSLLVDEDLYLGRMMYSIRLDAPSGQDPFTQINYQYYRLTSPEGDSIPIGATSAILQYGMVNSTEVIAPPVSTSFFMPNPGSDKLILNFSPNNPGILRLMDIYGHVVGAWPLIPGERNQIFYVADLPSGMYIVLLYENGQLKGRDKWIKH